MCLALNCVRGAVVYQKLQKLAPPETAIVLKILDKYEDKVEHPSHKAIFYEVWKEATKYLDIHFKFWRRGCLEFGGHFHTPDEQHTAVLSMKVSLDHTLAFVCIVHFNIMINRLLWYVNVVMMNQKNIITMYTNFHFIATTNSSQHDLSLTQNDALMCSH